MNKLLITALTLTLSSAAYAADPFTADDYHGSILRDVQSRTVSATAVQPGIGDRDMGAAAASSVRTSARFVNEDLGRSILNDVGHNL